MCGKNKSIKTSLFKFRICAQTISLLNVNVKFVCVKASLDIVNVRRSLEVNGERTDFNENLMIMEPGRVLSQQIKVCSLRI